MDLKTTTRPNRHAEQFREARRLLDLERFDRPIEVLEVGPGLAVKFLGRLAEEGRPAWDLVKRIETGVRRIPMPDACYESYETGELLAALHGLPVRLTILDINPRVLRIVRQAHAGIPIETVVADLGEERPASLLPLYGRFDLVVANAVLARVGNPGRNNACEAIRSLVKPGGILLGTGGFAAAGFQEVSGKPNFYVRARV